MEQNIIDKLKAGQMIYRSSGICLKSDLGANNCLFGGRLLSRLDEIAAELSFEICCNNKMVTKKIEEVIFEKSVKEGNVVKYYGALEKIGNTSITLKIQARVYNTQLETESNVCTTRFVMVRIDTDDCVPIPISDKVKNRFGYIQ